MRKEILEKIENGNKADAMKLIQAAIKNTGSKAMADHLRHALESLEAGEPARGAVDQAYKDRFRVITWQSGSDQTINICLACEPELKANDEWPKDSTGAEYCRVSKGLHRDSCDICNVEAIDPEYW